MIVTSNLPGSGPGDDAVAAVTIDRLAHHATIAAWTAISTAPEPTAETTTNPRPTTTNINNPQRGQSSTGATGSRFDRR